MRLIALAALLLVGCATAPKTPTFPTLLSAAYSLDDAVYIAGNQAFVSGLITSAQGHQILDAADTLKAALDTANSLYLAGNAQDAGQALAKAAGNLALIQHCATAPDVKTSLDACLQGVKP